MSQTAIRNYNKHTEEGATHTSFNVDASTNFRVAEYPILSSVPSRKQLESPLTAIGDRSFIIFFSNLLLLHMIWQAIATRPKLSILLLELTVLSSSARSTSLASRMNLRAICLNRCFLTCFCSVDNIDPKPAAAAISIALPVCVLGY